MNSSRPREVVSGGKVKKRHDPLWEIVEEKFPLQGAEDGLTVKCPYCHVAVQLSRGMVAGSRFECGLCGSRCELFDDGQGRQFDARSVEEDQGLSE